MREKYMVTPPSVGVERRLLSILAVGLLAGPIAAHAQSAPARVPLTGQTTSYAIGDDGDLQKGVVWPVPRFTDKGNGTITDNLTKLIWLKNANCAEGIVNWYGAFDYVAELNANGSMDSQQCGDMSKGRPAQGTHQTDWRLPNVRELLSLVDYGAADPSLPAGHPFTNVQVSNYWSSTSEAEFAPDLAWVVGFRAGGSDSRHKIGDSAFVIAVRGGP